MMLVLLLTAGVASAQELRTWKEADGDRTLQAKFVRMGTDGKVVLQREDGREFAMALEKLSPTDRDYVKARQGQSQGPSDRDNQPLSSAKRVTLEAVEAEANLCRTAKEAAMVFKFHWSGSVFAAAERPLVEQRMKHWQELAEKDHVRLGNKWLPRTEVEAIQTEAQNKVARAVEMMRLGNYPIAHDILKDASREDPDAIDADFLMGLVFGLVADNDKDAEKHFRECLKRDPDNIAAVNNLAVSMVFQKKYRQAVEQWRKAVVAAPNTQTLAQNIGTFLSLSSAPNVRLTKTDLRMLSDLYDTLTTKHGLAKPTQLAFAYMMPYGSKLGSDKGEQRQSAGSVTVGSGAGFVVHDNLILTNKHVVANADGILVVDPANPDGAPLAATLVAESETLDLALIRCDSLTAPPVPLSSSLPERGSDIMVLGYPLGVDFGKTLKSTRGAMVAMPDASVDNMCLFDAVTNPGNSGGPLCDQSGRVVGVVRAVTGGIGGSYGAAIPIETALEFLKQQIPELTASKDSRPAIEWREVDRRVSPSTVLILTKQNMTGDLGVGTGQRESE